MTSEHYKTPASDMSGMESVPGSSPKAIVYGVLIDIGGSVLLGIALTIIYAGYLASQGMMEEQIQEALVTVETFSLVGLSGLVLGFGISILAGYVCAKTSKAHIIRDLVILSAISGSFSLLLSISSYGLLGQLLMIAATVLAIFSGGYLGKRALA